MKEDEADNTLREESDSVPEDLAKQEASLLQDINKFEEENSNLRKEIFQFESKLITSQSPLHKDMTHPLGGAVGVMPTQTVSYHSIDLKRKFYEFTGVAFKHFTENTVTAYFYPKRDDGTNVSEIRPYWVVISRHDGSVTSYDLPFMTSLKTVMKQYPMSSEQDLLVFVDYIRRCCESYFERRQQVHELEIGVDKRFIKIFPDMQYLLIQIKSFAKKSKPEIEFSIWYKEDAILPHQHIVRIADSAYKPLWEKITKHLEVLYKMPLPEAFTKATEEALPVDSSSEVLVFEDDTLSELDWGHGSDSDRAVMSKKKHAKGESAVKNNGYIRSENDGDDASAESSEPGPPPRKILAKPSKGSVKKKSSMKSANNDGGSSDSDSDTEIWLGRKCKSSRRKQEKTSPKSRKIYPDPSDSDSALDFARKHMPVGKGLPLKKKHQKKEINTNRPSKKIKENKKSAVTVPLKQLGGKTAPNMLTTAKSTDNEETGTELRKNTKDCSRGSIASYMTKTNMNRAEVATETVESVPKKSTQSSIKEFLKVIKPTTGSLHVSSKSSSTKVGLPKPRENDIHPIVYPNDFDFEDCEENVRIHSADAVPRASPKSAQDGEENVRIHSADAVSRASSAQDHEESFDSHRMEIDVNTPVQSQKVVEIQPSVLTNSKVKRKLFIDTSDEIRIGSNVAENLAGQQSRSPVHIQASISELKRACEKSVDISPKGQSKKLNNKKKHTTRLETVPKKASKHLKAVTLDVPSESPQCMLRPKWMRPQEMHTTTLECSSKTETTFQNPNESYNSASQLSTISKTQEVNNSVRQLEADLETDLQNPNESYNSASQSSTISKTQEVDNSVRQLEADLETALQNPNESYNSASQSSTISKTQEVDNSVRQLEADLEETPINPDGNESVIPVTSRSRTHVHRSFSGVFQDFVDGCIPRKSLRDKALEWSKENSGLEVHEAKAIGSNRVKKTTNKDGNGQVLGSVRSAEEIPVQNRTGKGRIKHTKIAQENAEVGISKVGSNPSVAQNPKPTKKRPVRKPPSRQAVKTTREN